MEGRVRRRKSYLHPAGDKTTTQTTWNVQCCMSNLEMINSFKSRIRLGIGTYTVHLKIANNKIFNKLHALLFGKIQAEFRKIVVHKNIFNFTILDTLETFIVN